MCIKNKIVQVVSRPLPTIMIINKIKHVLKMKKDLLFFYLKYKKIIPDNGRINTALIKTNSSD